MLLPTNFYYGSTTPSGPGSQDLVEFSRSHSDTPQPVGLL